ncbi:epsilon-sarcoglycan-like [Ascaphus truei]|uniref:epsilon-sarcoglycan-like n=1 Tax=Ascaphus truei TaxID=8439 RepID=UPI003F5A5F4A
MRTPTNQAKTAAPVTLPLSESQQNMAPKTVRLLTAALWLSLSGCLSEQNFNPPLGAIFVLKLDIENFKGQFPSVRNKYVAPPSDDARSDPITFKANLEGFPDLPRWLRYTQRSPWHTAYLYGSPTEPGKQVIEVTAYNRHTYETARHRIIFNIEPATAVQTPFRAEFLVLDWDVEELLPPDAQLNFRWPLQDVWGPQRVTVVNITSALDKGGRVPLPLPGRKEGVYIMLGSDAPFPGCLLESQSPETLQLCQYGLEPLTSCADRWPQQFHIDWCNVSLTDDSGSPPPLRPEPGLGVMEGGGDFNPPSETMEGANYLPDYLLTLLLPLLTALLLCLLLSYIMCCRREGV